MNGFLDMMKSSLDFQGTQPFLLINKKQLVPSWCGAITTLIAYIFAFLFCIGEIKEVVYQTTPIITEDFFDPLIDGTGAEMTLIDDFYFKFSVRGSLTDFWADFLDETFFTPELYLLYFIDGEYFVLTVDLYKYTEGGLSTYYTIHPNQTELTKEEMIIFATKADHANLYLTLSPCFNSTDPGSVVCASQEDIDLALRDANVELVFPANNIDLQRVIKQKDGTVISRSEQYIQVSLKNPKSMKNYYDVRNYTKITPLQSMISFISPPETKTIPTLVQSSVDPLESDLFFFDSLWAFDFKTGRDTEGNPYNVIDGKSFTITYKSFPEVLAAYNSMKDLLFFIIPLFLSLMGYFEGNYYNEVIYSFFGVEENRKKVVNIYDKVGTGEDELFPISPSINNTNSSDNINNINNEKEVDNNDKKEKLINPKKVEFSKFNKIWDGTITGMIKFLFCCPFFKSTAWKENNALFNQAKNIIDTYIDIIFIMKKNFEFEVLKNNKENIRPRLISGLDMKDIKDEEEAYKKWIRVQKVPVDEPIDNDTENNQII